MTPSARRHELPIPSTVPAEAAFRSRLSWFLGVSEPATVDPGALTYEPSYGLREKAFSLGTDPRFFFTQSQHGKAFNTLAAGVRRREGILVLTGEVGTGKTTLCRAVLEALDRTTFAAFVPDPFLTREDLLKTLLVEFGVVSADELRRGVLRNASRTDLCYPLYSFLGSLSPLRAFAVVMIDEAQNLSPALLEEIRILSDLERGEKLLEVVLVGQPELERRLTDPALRQLSQRVAVRCDLQPLAVRDIGPYIAHRLAVAGSDGRVRFTDAAAERIHAVSSGIPRVVNLICDGALARAAMVQSSVVDADRVAQACEELKIPVAVASVITLVHSQPAAPARVMAPSSLPDEPQTPAPESLVRALSGVIGEVAPEDDRPLVPDTADGLPSTAPALNFWMLEPRQADVRGPVEIRDGRASAPNSLRRWLAAAVGAACIAVAASVAYERFPLTRTKPEPPLVSRAAAEPPVPETPRSGDAAAPRTTTPLPAASERVAILVATFQSDDRAGKAIEELRDAGLSAFTTDVALRDGARGLAVYIGPYPERAAADRDWETARKLPGYESARIVAVHSTH